MKVRLYSSWLGHRYGDIVEVPLDDHTVAWLGMGLCEPVDDDDWDAMGVDDDMLRVEGEDEQGPADAAR